MGTKTENKSNDLLGGRQGGEDFNQRSVWSP